MFCALEGQDIRLAFTGPLILWFMLRLIYSGTIMSGTVFSELILFVQILSGLVLRYM